MSYTHFGPLCQRCTKSYTPLFIEKNIPGLHYIGVKLVKSRKNAYAHVQHWIYYRSYLNYYLSFDVCACFHLSFCKKKKNRPKWIKFANSVNRHLEFQNSSPKGLKASDLYPGLQLQIPTENCPACFKNKVLKYSQDIQINNRSS